MAIGAVIFSHEHKWRRWLVRVPKRLVEVAPNVQAWDGSKLVKGYKCWRCGVVSETNTEKRMKSLRELHKEWRTSLRRTSKGKGKL